MSSLQHHGSRTQIRLAHHLWYRPVKQSFISGEFKIKALTFPNRGKNILISRLCNSKIIKFAGANASCYLHYKIENDQSLQFLVANERISMLSFDIFQAFLFLNHLRDAYMSSST